MSKPLSYSYFQKQYIQRIAAGELFVPEPESPAVDMFIAELNKSPQGDADFSVYKFDDIEWREFLSDIFSSDEYLGRTDTGFQYRAIDEASCAECLRTFIGKITKVETKLALLNFFMSDDFQQDVLRKGYCAYSYSADMIQLLCAKLMGEINRSLHGEVAPDLANLPDDYGDDIDDNQPQKPTKKLFFTPDGPQVLEVYELSKNQSASEEYLDDEHEQVLSLLRQGNMLKALLTDLEATFDVVKSFYEDVKPEQEGILLFKPQLCAQEDVTIFNFHRTLLGKYETIDTQNAPTPKSDYSFFESNYQTLLRYKEQCNISILPQLWDKHASEYIHQAYYISHEMRKHGYDTQDAYTMYHLFMLGYNSPLFHSSGEYAEKFLRLACLIQDEYRLAEEARNRAKGYGVELDEMPGDCPCLRDMYYAAITSELPSEPIVWLSAQLMMATDSFEKRISWLTNILEHEADELSLLDVPYLPVDKIKSACHLLIRFYTRLLQIVQRDTDAAAYYKSSKPDDRCEAETCIIFSDITARELFALSQSIYSGQKANRSIQMIQALWESSLYVDKLVSSSLFECINGLRIVCNYHEMYQQIRPYSIELERHINDFLADFFLIYTQLRKEQVSEEISRSRFSYKKPTEDDCLRRILSDSQSCVESLRTNDSIDPSDLELCELYLNYLQEELITPVDKAPMPETPAPNEPDKQVEVELDLDTDLDNSFFEQCVIKSKHLKYPDNLAGYYEYNPNEGLVFYANDPSNEHNSEVIFPGIYGAIVKLMLDKRFHDAERQYMNQRYMLHQHVDFCLLDHFFEAYLKFEPAYYESTEVICDLYHWWEIFTKNLQLLDQSYPDDARQIIRYIIHYIGVNKSPRPLTPDVIFTEPMADSYLIRWKNKPTPDDLELCGEEYAVIKYLLIEKYAIVNRPSPLYVQGFTETLLVLIAENTREETLRSIDSIYINEEKYPRSSEYIDDNPLPMLDRINYLLDERDLVFTFARFSPDDIYEAHLRRAKQDLPEYFHAHRFLRKDYEGVKIYSHIFKNELLLAANLLKHDCIKPLIYKTRCELVSYLGMFLVYMADVYYVDPGYKQIRKVLTPLLDQLHNEDHSRQFKTFDNVLDENGRVDYDKIGANLFASITEPINICLKPLEDKLGYVIPDDCTSAEDEALAYVKSIFHKIDGLLDKSYSPQWIDSLLEYIQQDPSTAIKFQKAEHKIADRPIYLCMGAVMNEGIFGDNTAPQIVKALKLKPNTNPSSGNVQRYLNDGTATNKFTQKIRDFIKNN